MPGARVVTAARAGSVGRDILVCVFGQFLSLAEDPGARSLVRLSWAWGLLLLAGGAGALILLLAMRHARRMTRSPERSRPAPPRVDAWAESAKRLRPDDPSAPRERGSR